MGGLSAGWFGILPMLTGLLFVIITSSCVLRKGAVFQRITCTCGAGASETDD